MPLTPATFRQVGEALYGPNWQGPLGKDLGVRDRTMREWQNDDARLPPGLVDELAHLCEERGRALITMAHKLTETGLEGMQGGGGGGFQTQVHSTMRKPGEIRKR